ncbi:MAG: HAD-IA family hydrolase, partial [Thermoguttaceae bacterium]|nr:HAD-IA family hydrolase [Thermoguttaceae bacterium]
GRVPEAVPGKPDPAMLQGIMERYRLEKDEIAMVGDRLYTDLEMARRAGVVGVLVLTGEATQEDHEKSDLQPELVLDNISTLGHLLTEAKKN